jgi:hypothetical protein
MKMKSKMPFKQCKQYYSITRVSCDNFLLVTHSFWSIANSISDDKGTVFIGVFGVPHTNEDDPLRAVKAALEINQTLHNNFKMWNSIGVT